MDSSILCILVIVIVLILIIIIYSFTQQSSKCKSNFQTGTVSCPNCTIGDTSCAACPACVHQSPYQVPISICKSGNICGCEGIDLAL